MPAAAPPIADKVAKTLVSLGQRLRAQREALRVSATTAAEAAGMSRVTLHRIEQGEPSVTMGAYMSAMAAIGLALDLVDIQPPRDSARGRAALPKHISLSDYPQLKRIAWQLGDVATLTPKEALAVYERNWKHVDKKAMSEHERALVRLLSESLARGRLLV